MNFDYWLKLYKEDPKRFEHERTALLESEINKAKPQNQLKLKALQAKINRIRRTSKNPMNSLIIINNMMFLEFDNLRKSLL